MPCSPTDERIPEKNAPRLYQFFLKAFLHGPLYQPRSQTWTAQTVGQRGDCVPSEWEVLQWIHLPRSVMPVQAVGSHAPSDFKCNFQNNYLCLWKWSCIIVVGLKGLLWKRLQSLSWYVSRLFVLNGKWSSYTVSTFIFYTEYTYILYKQKLLN